mgnify:CR=1 FL=1
MVKGNQWEHKTFTALISFSETLANAELFHVYLYTFTTGEILVGRVLSLQQLSADRHAFTEH